jgi:2-keto-4-pentenoate hydratase
MAGAIVQHRRVEGSRVEPELLILLKNPIAEALFMLIDVERRMIFHCGSSLQ